MLTPSRFFPLGPEHFTRATAQTIDKAHGRFEIRSIESVSHSFSDWPEVKQIFHIVRQRERGGHYTEEHVYGITSLPPDEANPKELLKFSRNHWHIENKLHYVRDMTLREDQSWVRHKGKAQIMCAIRNTIIALAALAGFSNVQEAIGAFGE